MIETETALLQQDPATTDNWQKAFSEARRVRDSFEHAIGRPGLNTSHILNEVIAPLMIRYVDGERTTDLYDSLVDLQRAGW